MKDPTTSSGPRLATAAALFVWATALGLGFEAAVPRWLVGIATTLDLDPGIALRILTGLLVAVAGIIVTLGRFGWGLANLAAIGLIFNGIAEATHVLKQADAGGSSWWLVPATGLVGIVLLTWSTLGGVPRSRPPFARPGLVGTGVALALLVGAGVAANLRIALPRSLADDPTDRRARTVEDLSTETWVGLPLAETRLLEHLPQVEPLSADQPTLVAFYRPECAACHTFFDEHLGSPPPARTIAVRVPPAAGVDPVDTGSPGEVSCRSCIHLSLPEGPTWLVETPTVLILEDGVVTCVTGEDYERCLSRLRGPGRG